MIAQIPRTENRYQFNCFPSSGPPENKSSHNVAVRRQNARDCTCDSMNSSKSNFSSLVSFMLVRSSETENEMIHLSLCEWLLKWPPTLLEW